MLDTVATLVLIFGIGLCWAAWDHARHEEMRAALGVFAFACAMFCLAAFAAAGARSPMDLATLPCLGLGDCR